MTGPSVESLFFAYRRGRLSAGQTVAVSQRLTADREFAEAWLRTGRFESDLESLVIARAQRHVHDAPSSCVPLLPDNHPRPRPRSCRPGAKRRSRSKNPATPWLAAAAALLVTVALWLSLPSAQQGHGILVDGTRVAPGTTLDIETGRRELRFDDGSTITATAPARLIVGAAADPVRLRLEAGHIEAAIAHQQTEGFTVLTPHARITVLGTVFALSVDDQTRIEVREGRVAVEDDRGRHVLRAGQEITLAAKRLPGLIAGESEEPPPPGTGIVRIGYEPYKPAQLTLPPADDPLSWIPPGSRQDLATTMDQVAAIAADLWLVLPITCDTATIDRLAPLIAERLPAGRTLYLQFGHEPWNVATPDGQVAAEAAGRPGDSVAAGHQAIAITRRLGAHWRSTVNHRVMVLLSLSPLPFAPRKALSESDLSGIDHLVQRVGITINMMSAAPGSMDETAAAAARVLTGYKEALAWTREQALGLILDCRRVAWLPQGTTAQDRDRVLSVLDADETWSELAELLRSWWHEDDVPGVMDLRSWEVFKTVSPGGD